MDDLPNLRRAMAEMRAEHRDVEVLRLKRRCQELHARIRELQDRLEIHEQRPAA